MKRVIYFILVGLSVLQTGAMEKATDEKVILSFNESTFEAPKNIAKKTILAAFTENNTMDLELSDSPLMLQQLNLLSKIMNLENFNKNLRGKKLLDFIGSQIDIKTSEMISLLKTADFFNYRTALQFVAHEVIKAPFLINKIIELRNNGEISQNSFDEIGRYYYLKFHNKLPEITSGAVCFSIRDYLDYYPEAIAPKPYTIGDHDGLILVIKILHLNSLDGLQEIPNIDKVISLNLNDNLLKKIKATDFEKMNYLLSLYLANNSIEIIHPEAFSNLHLLDTIELGENQLRDLPPTLFCNNLKLGHIGLRCNQLNHLNKDLFRGLNSLKAVYLAGNKIKHINPNTLFKGLHTAFICLGSNPLTEQSKKFIQDWNEKYSYPHDIGIRILLPHIEF